ncbi:MAG: BNR-repeat neuraminidase N-terminal domain-containing protein, partial [Bacteroidota bacterium]
MTQPLQFTGRFFGLHSSKATAISLLRKNLLVPLLFVIALLYGQGSYAQTYITEDFETDWSGTIPAPTGWTQTRSGFYNGAPTGTASSDGQKDWQRATVSGTTFTTTTAPAGTIANHGNVPLASSFSGTGMLFFNEYYSISASSFTQLMTRRIESPAVNTASFTEGSDLRASFLYAFTGGYCNVVFTVSSDGGTTWTDIASLGSTGTQASATAALQRFNVAVPNAYRSANTKIGFKVTAAYGAYDIFIDKVVLSEYTPVIYTVKAGTEGYNLWSSACSWVDGVVPPATGYDKVVVPSGTTIILDQSVSVKELTVAGTVKANAGAVNTYNFGKVSISAGGDFDFTTTGAGTTSNACSAATFTAGTNQQTFNILGDLVNAGSFRASATTSNTITMFLGGNINNTGGTFALQNATSLTTWLSGGTSQTISGNTPVFNMLNLFNPAGFVATTPITTKSASSSALTPVYGRLNMGSNLFWADVSASGSTYASLSGISVTSPSWVQGKLSYTMPTGTGNTRYFPVGDAVSAKPCSLGSSTTMASMTNNSLLTVELVPFATAPTFTSPGVTAIFGSRAYKLEWTGTGSPFRTNGNTNFTETFTADEVANMSGNNSDLVVAQSTSLTGPFTAIAATGTGTAIPSPLTLNTAGSTTSGVVSGTYLTVGTKSSGGALTVSASAFDNTFASSVSPGGVNVNIGHFSITTTGIIGKYKLTDVTVTANNANDADVTNIKLWTSGTSASFASATQLSSGTVTFSSGTASFSGLSTFLAGASASHFWVTYDLSPTATGNFVGAKLNTGSVVIAASYGANAPGTLPASLQTLATRVVESPMTFNSQTVSRSAPSGTKVNGKYKIIDVLVNMSSGGGLDLTTLNFNTGTGSYATTTLSDIATAQVYYSSNNFIDSVLFGSVTSPGASFAVTGAKTLSAGNNYFRLHYTPSSTASNFDVLNAEFVSSVIGGTTRACTAPDCSTPAGNLVFLKSTTITQNFEGGPASNGWSTNSSSSVAWSSITASSAGNAAVGVDALGSGSGKIGKFNSDEVSSGFANLISPAINISGSNTISVKFWVYRDNSSSFISTTDYMQLWYSAAAPASGGAPSGTCLYVVSRSSGIGTAPSGTPTAAGNNGITPGVAPSYTSGNAGWKQYTVDIPSTLPASGYVTFRGSSSWGYNIFVDEISIGTFTSSTYTSSAAVQQTEDLSPGTPNAKILQIPVVIAGNTNFMSAKTFNLSTNGSTRKAIAGSNADISAARLYYTGTSSTFAATGQFGTDAITNDPATGAFAITGTQILTAGTNYFWLVYDVPSVGNGAVLNNVIDAEVTGIVLNDDLATPKIPTVTAPAGNRLLTIPMTFNSIAVLRNETGRAPKGGTSQILDVNVVMNSGGPISLTSLAFNTGAAPYTTTNVADITAANVYYSATADFASPVLFGTTTVSGTAFTVTGSKALSSGNNYFRLYYAVSPNAANFNVLNAEFVSCSLATSPAEAHTCVGCTPAGYKYVYQLGLPVTENVEGASPFTGWTVNASSNSSTTPTWAIQTVAAATQPTVTADGSGNAAGKFALFNSYNAALGSSANLISPLVDFTSRGTSQANISFDVYRDDSQYPNDDDYLQVWWSPTAPTAGAAPSTDATLLYVVHRYYTVTGLPSGNPSGASNNGVVPSVAPSETKGWHRYYTSVPASYTASGYLVLRGVSGFGNYLYIDNPTYSSFPAGLTYQAYTSSTGVQQTGDVSPGSVNARILQIPVVITGANTPLSVTALNLSTNGSTRPGIAAGADITAARVFYTGTSATFATTTQFGATATANNATTGDFTVTGSQALSEGTNYFWLAYDVPTLSNGSVLDNVVDGEVKSITLIDDQFTPRNPTVTAPALNRLITAPMNVTSAAVSQLSNGVNVAPGTNDVQIVKVAVNTDFGAPISVSSVVFNTTAITTAADLSSARLYYTTANTFSSASQFGTAVTSFTQGADFTFTSGSGQALATGANYFWLVYDVKATAQTYDALDASLTGITISGNTYNGASTPAVTTAAPSGFRQVYSAATPVTEPFNAAIPNTGWSVYGNTPSITWQNKVASSVTDPVINVDAAGSASGNVAYFNSYSSSYPAGSIADLVSPVLDLGNRGSADAIVSFSTYRSSAYTTSPDYLMVWLSPTKPTTTDALPSGSTLLYYVNRINTKTDVADGTPTTAGSNNGFTPIITGSESTGWHTYSVNLPASAAGYIVFRAVSGYGDNIVLDEINLPAFPPAMVFNSASGTATNTDLALGTVNAKMQTLKFSVTGVGSPISLKTLNISPAGTTNAADILNAKVYATGNSSTFAAGTQFGTTVAAPTGAFTVSGSTKLVNGDNYFWVVYDVTAAAGSTNNSVAATVSSYTLSSAPETPATISGGTATRILKAPMTFISYALTYPTEDPLTPGSTANPVVKLDLNMSSGASLDLSTLRFTSGGSDAPSTDLAGATLVTTGSSAVYNSGTATQFGSAIASSPYLFTGTYALNAGHNYFWLLYDIKPGAVKDDVVGARLTQATISGIATDPISTNQTPAGTAPKIGLNYCAVNLQTIPCSTSGIYIKTVSLAAPANSPGTVTTLNNTSNCPAGSSGYSTYSPSAASATVTAGLTYTLTVTPSASGQAIGAWFDANRSGTFETSEFFSVTEASVANQPVTAAILIPGVATVGKAGLRVRIESNLNSGSACTSFAEGETEDYYLTVVAPSACSGTPVAGTISGPNAACSGVSTTLRLSDQTSGYTGLTYVWKSSSSESGPFNPISGATSATYNTGTSISGTTYFKASIACSGGTEVETPVFTFSIIQPVYASLPYAQNFENWASVCGTNDAPASWRNNSALTGDASWRRNDNTSAWSASTAGSGAYFPFASDSTYSARFHSSATASTSNFDLYINLGASGGSAKRLGFDYINTDGADVLNVSVSSNGTTWTALGNFGNAATWTTRNITIPASFSGNVQIRFSGTGQNTAANSSDIGLDNVQVESSPICSGEPTAGSVVVTPPANPCDGTTGRSYTLGLEGYSTDEGITVAWYRSVNNGLTWGDPIGTSLVLTTNVPLSGSESSVVTNYLFKAVLTCSGSGLSDEVVQQITLNPPTAGTVPTSVTFCPGASVTLAATGSTTGLTYQWSASATGGEGTFTDVSGATALTYTFSPTATTTQYYRLKVKCGTKIAYTNTLALNPSVGPVYATLPFTESFENTWTSKCATRELPGANWSQAKWSGDASWRRNDDGAAGGWTYPTDHPYTPSASDGSYSARLHSNFDGSGSVTGSDLRLYLNFSNPSASPVNRQLTFDYINPDLVGFDENWDELTVSVSTDGGANFNELDTYDTENSWSTKTLSLLGYNTANFVIRFTATDDEFGLSDIGIDNIVVSEQCNGAFAGSVPATAPYCGDGGASFRAVNTSQKPLSIAPGISYLWQHSTGNSPYNWVTASGGSDETVLSYTTATGLTGTHYYRLKVSCSAGPVAYSDVITVNAQQYTVAVVNASTPFIMDFEDTWLSACATHDRPGVSWVQSEPNVGEDADASWRREDDGSSAGWASTSGAYSPTASTGSHSARFHTYDASSDLAADLLVHLNLSGAVNRQLTFDYINTSGSDVLTVSGSSDGVNYTELGTYNTASSWTNQVIQLNDINAADYTIRFSAVSDYGFSDIGLDNVVLAEQCSGTIAGGSVPANAYYCSS